MQQVGSEGWGNLGLLQLLQAALQDWSTTEALTVPKDIPMVWSEGAWLLANAFQGQNSALGISPALGPRNQTFPVTRHRLPFHQRYRF